MTRDVVDATIAFIRTNLQPRTGGEDDDAPRPVITIARDHGAGAEQIAPILAEKLGVTCYDKEILDQVVRRTHADPHLMQSLDEKVKDRLGMFLYATVYGLGDPISDYQKALIKTIVGIAGLGGVIVGRGANVILREKPIFRLRLVGSDEVCARRLSAGGSGTPDAALAEVRTVNEQRAKFLWDHFGIRGNDPVNYDLVVNTDGFGDFGKLADVILAAQRCHRPELASAAKA